MADSLPSADREVIYAGFWIRVAASLVDSLLLSVITTPFLLLLYRAERVHGGSTDLLLSTLLTALLVILFWSWKQGTPGKLMFRLRIVDARSGGEPSLGQWCLRYLGYVVSSLPLMLGFLWVAWDPRHQGWHDRIAGTVVIHPPLRTSSGP
jgi:uncharacterized RDD family membrane protein YckC